nr:MAG TPA: hypothetical protein [Caudoviricetes sp.]
MKDNTEAPGGCLGRRRERPQEWQVCHALDSHVGFDSPTLHEQK